MNRRNEWPYTTPSGYTYENPTTWEQTKHYWEHAALAMIEGLDEAEHPPEPTWETFGPARRMIEALQIQNAYLQDELRKAKANRETVRWWRAR